jgi:putative membrane protein
MNDSHKSKTLVGQFTLLAASASLLFVLAAPATFAQSKSSDPATRSASAINPATRKPSDSTFAKEAAQGGAAEVQFGKLAEEKGTTQQVKDFGRRMVSDHTKAGEKLKTAASEENISLPTDMTASDKATYDYLSKLSGTAFDRAYAEDMVKDHQKDVNSFEREANNGKDSNIKSFASETLPTLQEHLKMARDMNSATSGRNTSKTPTHS